MGGPDPDRNSRVKFLKRCKTLKNKAHQLAQLCDADVYLLIIHPRERYAYNSTGDRSWPPSDEVLVSAARSDQEFQTKRPTGATLSWFRAEEF